MLKVVYIMGHARSGSTILDILLGQHPQVFSGGELRYFYEVFLSGSHYCSCKGTVAQCGFWNSVLELLRNRLGYAPLEEQWANMTAVEGKYRALGHLFFCDYSSESIEKYAQQALDLYKSIAEASGCHVIVDSSKDPLRGRVLVELHRRRLLDVSFIHLVRDCRGVVWSMKKRLKKAIAEGIDADKQPRNMYYVMMTWLGCNMICDTVMKKVAPGKGIRLNYSDFCNDPVSAIRKIAGIVGINPEPILDGLAAEYLPDMGHLLAGNRIRLQSKLRIKHDLAWQANTSAFHNAMFWFLTGWKAKQYGMKQGFSLSRPTVSPTVADPWQR